MADGLDVYKRQGYGFAGEGDWKTAALLRIMKVMSTGLQGGTSFMEDYTCLLYTSISQTLWRIKEKWGKFMLCIVMFL